MTREQIATELLRDCPKDALDDHIAIAEAVRSGESIQEILEMDSLDNWPETYSWLKNVLGNGE